MSVARKKPVRPRYRHNMYSDRLGGVGYSLDRDGHDFRYILGNLPEGWPQTDTSGRFRWWTAGPFSGTAPQIWAAQANAKPPSLDARSEGQCDCDGLLASVFVEDDGTFRVILDVCDIDVDHEIQEITFDTADAAREATSRAILDHFADAPDGGCKECGVRQKA